MNVYKGIVESILDDYAGGRIQARILPYDKGKPLVGDGKVPFSFPILPKMVHIMPKVGETVFIFTDKVENPDSQRYYLGPIISQPQRMYKDDAVLGATSMLDNSSSSPSKSVDNDGEAIGSFAKDDEIALYGRKNTDIILSDFDVRIRCGSRHSNRQKDSKIVFNKKNPSFIKLKFHEDGLANSAVIGTQSYSTSTIVGDEINLIANSGDPYFKMYNSDGQIKDEDMQEIINKAHVLPYGDVLVDFLLKFLAMFKNHTHKYHNLPPCADSFSNAFDMEYGYQPAKSSEGSFIKKASGRVIEDVSSTFRGLGSKLLSKHVRIN